MLTIPSHMCGNSSVHALPSGTVPLGVIVDRVFILSHSYAATQNVRGVSVCLLCCARQPECVPRSTVAGALLGEALLSIEWTAVALAVKRFRQQHGGWPWRDL